MMTTTCGYCPDQISSQKWRRGQSTRNSADTQWGWDPCRKESIGQGHYSKGKSQSFSSVCFSLHLFRLPCAMISTRNLKLRHDLCPQSKEEGTDNTHSTAMPQAAWQDLWYWHHKGCWNAKEATANVWMLGVMEERALMLCETTFVISIQSNGLHCDVFRHIHHYTMFSFDPSFPSPSLWPTFDWFSSTHQSFFLLHVT